MIAPLAVHVDARNPSSKNLAWRWGHANELLRLRLGPDASTDAPTFAAWAFLRDMSVAYTQREIEATRGRYPLVSSAHRVYRDAGSARRELESMLSEKMAITAISQASTLSADLIRAYRALFFDIDSRIVEDSKPLPPLQECFMQNHSDPIRQPVDGHEAAANEFRAAVSMLQAAARRVQDTWLAAGGPAELPEGTAADPDMLARAARNGMILAMIRTPLSDTGVAALEPRGMDAVLAAGAEPRRGITEDAIVDALADLAAFARVIGLDDEELFERRLIYEEFQPR